MADGMSAPTVSGLGRLWRRLSPLVGLALFLVALWVLGRELRYMPPSKLAAALKQFPGSAIGLATLFTFLNYFILTGYDQLAFLYIRRPIARWQIAMASFVGYAIANNVGFALLSGTSARYRFYSRWGLSGREISQVVIFYSDVLARPAGPRRLDAGDGAGDGPRPPRPSASHARRAGC